MNLVSALIASLALAATALLPLCAATPARSLDVPKDRLQRNGAANGLEVIAIRSSTSRPSASRSGTTSARRRPAGPLGFAHLFEHLMFKSTKYLKAPSSSTG